MNKKIIIPILIGITIIIIGIIGVTNQKSDLIQVEDTLDRELVPNEEMISEIQDKLNDIEEKNSEYEYSPKEREWLTSGPFQIDRSEYVLGEKIFLRIGELSMDEKGQITFLKPLNSTHYEVYYTIPFDGSVKSTFNYYLEPALSKNSGYCSVNEFIGNWRVVFRGTDYSNLEFNITEQILPGDEESFESVC